MADNRVVVLVDMDCFYCQVEVKLNPEHRGKPLAVVQYNPWRGGGIIAVNYEARDKGVKRGMRGDDAKKLCPEIVLCSVAEFQGKADISKYRDAGRDVVDVLQEFSNCIQVASIDESYIDITEAVEERMLQVSQMENGISLEKLPTTFVIGYCNDKSNDEDQRISGLQQWLLDMSEPSRLRLAVGAGIVEEMRAAVYERTSFRCSAGISYNKPLAKLVCGVHKPNRQTILPPDKVELFFSTLPLRKMRNLGGKFGTEVVERLGCQTLGDLARFSLRELQHHYDEKNGTWLYNIARGIDHEPVNVRLIPKSIGCSKNFPGKNSLATKESVEQWMRSLTTELVIRLTEDQKKNKRRAQLLTVSVTQGIEEGSGTLRSIRSASSSTRSAVLPCYNVDRIVHTALQLILKTNSASSSSSAWYPPIRNIGLSAGKFTEDCSSQKTSIQSFFKQAMRDHGQNSSYMQNSCSESNAKSTFQEVRKEQKPDHDAPVKRNPHAEVKSGKLPPLDRYFKHINTFPDNSVDINRSPDMFVDNSSVDEDMSDFSMLHPSNGETEADDKRNSKPFGRATLKQFAKEGESSKSSNPSEFAVCPVNIEDAATHSFFARYILSQKKAKLNQGIEKSDPKPSTSSENQDSFTDLKRNEPANSGYEEMFERCNDCGKEIPLKDFPEHVDFHSALKLQKELNENLTPPSNEALDTLESNRVPNTKSHHSNKTTRKDSGGPSLDFEANSESLVEKCSDCGELIPLDEFPEHIDYHSALNLQRELNKVHPAPVTSSSVSVKRKKGRASKQVPSPAKKVKSASIASFFGLK